MSLRMTLVCLGPEIIDLLLKAKVLKILPSKWYKMVRSKETSIIIILYEDFTTTKQFNL